MSDHLTKEDILRWDAVRAEFLAAVDAFLARGGTARKAREIAWQLRQGARGDAS